MTAERATRGAGRVATLARATVMEALRAAARRRTADCMTGGCFVVDVERELSGEGWSGSGGSVMSELAVGYFFRSSLDSG